MVDEHMGDSKRSLQMYDESALIMTSKQNSKEQLHKEIIRNQQIIQKRKARPSDTMKKSQRQSSENLRSATCISQTQNSQVPYRDNSRSGAKQTESPIQASGQADLKLFIQHESESPVRQPLPQSPEKQPSNDKKSNGIVDSVEDDDGEYEEINDDDFIDDDNIIAPDPRI